MAPDDEAARKARASVRRGMVCRKKCDMPSLRIER